MPKDILQPEPQHNSELKPIDTTSSPAIGNTNVVGSQSHGSLEEVDLKAKEIVKLMDGLSRNKARQILRVADILVSQNSYVSTANSSIGQPTVSCS
jgi:hypothetical protein